MFKKVLPYLLATGLVVFSGCGAKTGDINIEAQTNKKVNLEGYVTYAWLPTSTIVVDSKSAYKSRGYDVNEYIESKINKELLNEDKIQTQTEPDFLVSFISGVNMDALKEKVDDDGKELLSKVPKAAVAILLIDPTNDRVIWAASADAKLDTNASDEESKERIAYAIEEMFDELD